MCVRVRAVQAALGRARPEVASESRPPALFLLFFSYLALAALLFLLLLLLVPELQGELVHDCGCKGVRSVRVRESREGEGKARRRSDGGGAEGQPLLSPLLCRLGSPCMESRAAGAAATSSPCGCERWVWDGVCEREGGEGEVARESRSTHTQRAPRGAGVLAARASRRRTYRHGSGEWVLGPGVRVRVR